MTILSIIGLSQQLLAKQLVIHTSGITVSTSFIRTFQYNIKNLKSTNEDFLKVEFPSIMDHGPTCISNKV